MRFYIKQKVLSLKDKFKVTDEFQNTIYEVKGKIMSLSNRLELLDLSENVLYKSHRKVFALFAEYQIFKPNGESVAFIKRKFSLRPNFHLTILGKSMDVEGSLFAHAFEIIDDGKVIASIQKKIISWGDTYEIEINDTNHAELYLFVIIILDQVLHEKKHS